MQNNVNKKQNTGLKQNTGFNNNNNKNILIIIYENIFIILKYFYVSLYINSILLLSILIFL